MISSWLGSMSTGCDDSGNDHAAAADGAGVGLGQKDSGRPESGGSGSDSGGVQERKERRRPMALTLAQSAGSTPADTPVDPVDPVDATAARRGSRSSSEGGSAAAFSDASDDKADDDAAARVRSPVPSQLLSVQSETAQRSAKFLSLWLC